MTIVATALRAYPLIEEAVDRTALRAMDPLRLAALAAELRALLIERVCATGGHLGPNLGMVEVTIALHRVFEDRQPVQLGAVLDGGLLCHHDTPCSTTEPAVPRHAKLKKKLGVCR